MTAAAKMDSAQVGVLEILRKYTFCCGRPECECHQSESAVRELMAISREGAKQLRAMGAVAHANAIDGTLVRFGGELAAQIIEESKRRESLRRAAIAKAQGGES